jgi:hypothetical protein
VKNPPGIFLSACAIAFFLLVGEHAEAHGRSQSFSSWTVAENAVEMRFTVTAREVTRLPPLEGEWRTLEALLLAHLDHSVHIRADGQACLAAGPPRALPAAPGYVRAQLTFGCPDVADRTVRIDSFFAVAPSHVHYARIAFGDEGPKEYLFTDDSRELDVTEARNRFDTFYRAFAQYTALGLEHIFGGLDHIAFLLALLLLSRRLREVIWMVSGFTLGHSITLSLAALGWVVPHAMIVEALIGFTIVIVALENVGAVTATSRQLAYAAAAALITMALVSVGWETGLPLLTMCGLVLFTIAYLPLADSRETAVTLRPVLTIAFGLVHGFGFAGVLSEIGLPDGRLVAALAGFNVGVELGQILIVAALWYTALWIRAYKPMRDYRVSLNAASAVLCALGSYWFVARSFAPG